MGLPADLARSSVRLTVGWPTTEAEVDEAVAVITAGVERLAGRAAGATQSCREAESMRVLVAMSGGVDSSVAAARLLAEGHDVTGVTLKLWGGESDSGCCSVSDVEDARRVAAQLGIPHYTFNFADDFAAAVVGPYVDAHAAGLTPNPCVECNRSIKFGRLLERAEATGFDAVATGHHARVVGRAVWPGAVTSARTSRTSCTC